MSDPGPATHQHKRFHFPESAHVADFVRTLLVVFLAAFGTPARLIARGQIGRYERLDLLGWLRAIEQLLRRYVTLEAFALMPSLPSTAPLRRPSPVREKARPAFQPANTATWRTTFAVLPHLPSAPPARPGDAFPASIRRESHAARPLALRLAAVVRIAADPAPLVARLARRLRRRMLRDQVSKLFAIRMTPWDRVNETLELMTARLLSVARAGADTS